MKKLSLVLLLILVVVGPIIVPNSEVKAATGGYGTVNLAKGKPVTPLTNTVKGNPGDVNDGSVASVWYSFNSNFGGNSNASSFVLDLGSVYNIGKIDIFPAQVHGFTINTSNDNTTWTERYKSPWPGITVNSPVSVTPDGAFSARYIKYWGYANWSQYVGVIEIGVYEWLASPPPTPSGANGSTNLALNKTVTNIMGSVIQSNQPTYAVDGNPATSWASSQSGRDDGTGKWSNYGQIKIDLGAKYRIGKVVVSPQRVHDFLAVLAETDPAPAGSPWVFTSYPELFGSAKTSSDPYTFSLNGAASARYIWLTAEIWGTPSSLQPAIAEIEVYEWLAAGANTSTAPAPTTTTAAVNLALNKPARQSSTYSASTVDDAQGAVNGVKNGSFGFHTNQEPNPWWQVDLQTVSTLNEIRILNRINCCSERARTIQVLLSNDGSSWRRVYSHDGSIFGGFDGKPLVVDLKGAPARYVRLQLNETNYLHLDEVEIYGIPGSAVTPSATPAPSPDLKATDASLVAEERTISPGGKTTVPIRLDKADRLGSLNFSLRYDSSVLKVNKADSGDLAGGTLFQANIRDAGIIRFGIVAQGTAGITGDGPVAHVEFTALGARGAQSQLSLGDLLATDTAGAKLGVTLRAGRISIATKLKGDYDGDGKIAAKDALAALKISVGELPEDLNLDMDGDGKVTAEDARRILAGALGGAIPAVSQPTQPTISLPVPVSTPRAAPATGPALPPLVSKVLQPSSSPQLVSYQDKVGVIIPGGTLQSSQTVTISPAPNLQAHPSKGFTQLAAYDVSMGNIREFKEALIIEIAYDPSVLPTGIRPDKAMSVAWWDDGLKSWVNAPFAVDTSRNVIIIPTTHLTVWEAVALVKNWRLEETEHFKIYYDPNDSFNVEGRVGLARILAEEVGLLLENDYKAYQEAGYSMRLTFIPSTGIGAVIGWLAGAGTGAVVGGVAGTVTGGPLAGLWGALAGADVGKNIGAGIGTAAGAILVNSKTYVILDSATVTAEWSKVKLGEIFIPLRNASMSELRHDLAHELFHAIQNGYFSMAEMGGPIADAWGINGHWWIEATADYAPVSVGLSKPDALPKIPLDYFKQSLPREGNEREYVTSRFIEYMAKRRVDFKAMWDDVACIACPQRVNTTMLQRIEAYHEQRQPNLHTLFRSWAAEVFFDSNSQIELETGKTLASTGAVSKDSTLSSTDSTVLYDFKLPSDYAAQLWRITVGLKDSQTERSLKVMAAAISEQGKVTVNAFVLPNDQRVPGGVATKLVPLYSDGGQTANVTVKKNETLYIMAVNSQTSGVNLSVRVSDDEQVVGGQWVLVSTKQSRNPETAVSDPKLTRSASISGKEASVVLEAQATGYEARWACNWITAPPEVGTRLKATATRATGNTAQVTVEGHTSKGPYTAKWVCDYASLAPPGMTPFEPWDGSVFVATTQSGQRGNVIALYIDKSRWICRWPQPDTLTPGQTWEGVVTVENDWSELAKARSIKGVATFTVSPSWTASVAALNSRDISVTADLPKDPAALPSFVGESERFKWQVPGPPNKQMTFTATCTANIEIAGGTSFNPNTSTKVEYVYELR